MESKKRKLDQKPESKMQNGSQARSVITVELETVEKISEIQRIIGKRLRTKDLVNHEIFLQDIKLNPKLSLYEQGVKVFGTVELSVQVETQGDSGRLTIVEIAKNMTDDEMQASAQLNTEEKKGSTSDTESQSTEKQRDLDIEKEDIGIPCDPKLWTSGQVHRWMMWVAREFGLDTSIIRDMGMSGKRISSMTIEEFFVKIPYGNILWSHLSLLKKISNPDSSELANLDEAPLNLVTNNTQGVDSSLPASKLQNPKMVRSPKLPCNREFGSAGPRSGSNGQIQLWQFLLELLTDPDERHLIAWVGSEGEFKLLQPERVAQKWGERKNKPAMNYEKLSRALRYYYDGDMINKVQGKRFVYQFVCNLKELLGYNAGELNRLVVECEQKRRSERQKGLGHRNSVINASSHI